MVVSMPNETLRTNDEQDLSNVLGIESYDFGITKCSVIFYGVLERISEALEDARPLPSEWARE
jgi:hypothetical protein